MLEIYAIGLVTTIIYMIIRWTHAWMYKTEQFQEMVVDFNDLCKIMPPSFAPFASFLLALGFLGVIILYPITLPLSAWKRYKKQQQQQET